MATPLRDDPDARLLVERLRAHGVDVSEVSGDVMAAMSAVRTPSGWVAIAEQPRHRIDQVFGRTPQLVVALGIRRERALRAERRASAVRTRSVWLAKYRASFAEES